jgi:hypothetical protein
MNQIQRFLLVAACLVSMSASAQWQWLDKDGRKVFSDRAPGPEVMEKDILRRPLGKSAPSVPQSEASAPRLSGIDKELIEKKKRADEAENARRKAEQEQFVKARIENCARAKQARSTYASGQRLSRINEKGERELVDDAVRSAELKRIDAIIQSDCN